MNTTSTKIWVKVPVLSASTHTKIVMYYGKYAALPMSNGDSTFVFFDNFDTLTSSKWFSYAGSGVSVNDNNGKLKYSGSGYANLVSKNMGITAPFIVHTKVNGYSAYSWDLCAVGYAKENTQFTRVNFFSGVALRAGSGFSSLGSPVTISSSTPITSTSCNTNYEFVSKVNANGSCNVAYPTGNVSIPSSSSTVTSATRISLGYYYNPGNATGVCSNGRIYDHVFVRNNVATDPVIDSIGEEEVVTLYFLALDPDTLLFDSSEQTFSVSLTSDTTWTIDTPASWISISALSGFDNTVLNITAAANTTGAPRSATLTARAGDLIKTVYIWQFGFTDSLELDPDTLLLGDTAGVMLVNLTSNRSWTIDTLTTSWLSVSTLSGTNDAALIIAADANATGAPRSTTITVRAGNVVKTIWVWQFGFTDSLAFDQDTLRFSSAADSQIVNLTSNTIWVIDTPAAWITIPALIGMNNAALTISVDANTTGTLRSATITARAGTIIRTIYVEQDAAVGLNDLQESAINLSVFPNPSNGVFSISYGNTANAIATLYDLQGKALKVYTLTAGDVINADCSELANGAYILNVATENESKHIRIVIAK
jgi:hypothetical protein